MKNLLATVVLCWGSMALAAPVEIKLPQETAKLRASKLPGYAIAVQKCAICHSADYINFQPPGMNQAQWTAEVAKMQHAFGAPITDDDVRQIGAYLAVAYGSAKATDASVANVSPAAAAPGAAIDVKALLNANACLGCHAVDKKVVGPGITMSRSSTKRIRRRSPRWRPASARAGWASGARCRCLRTQASPKRRRKRWPSSC
jgi:cytochrome c551/c552